ncbi:3-deoxy-D-manno-octulosonic acid transferase [Kangsaoukella pontilimi]|uniref:3-deoxy-D-manno-octulosonic acid transferase n=1 Tax=Kangsaoukella pontilimi TaxID=2691042 RepID=UPI0029C9D7C4|nr:glycosyltransferase N-terminal domain-containing protein [Kangsaoukella pontilimi]
MTGPRPRLLSRLFYAAGRLTDTVKGAPAAPPERATERLGQPTEARPEGLVLWLHARHPAECGVIAALTDALSEMRGEPVFGLATTQDAGALTPAARRNAVHQLAPGDTQGSVARFLDHWHPDMGVILGAPDRPALINEARRRGIPLFLAAAKRGETTGGRLGLLPASLVENFEAVFAPSAAEAEAFRKHLDHAKVRVTGPLSDTTLALPCNERERDRFQAALQGRPIWLAAEASADDLAPVEAAHRRALKASHRLLLILVPDRAQDGAGIAASLEARGWRTALRSAGEVPDETVQIFLADRPDELGLWYRLAPVAYLGGTLVAREAPPPDPFEPAALGCAVLHGPALGDAPWRFERLAAASASRRIPDAAALTDAVYDLLAPDKVAAMAHAGWSATSESAHVVEALVERLDLALAGKEAV